MHFWIFFLTCEQLPGLESVRDRVRIEGISNPKGTPMNFNDLEIEQPNHVIPAEDAGAIFAEIQSVFDQVMGGFPEHMFRWSDQADQDTAEVDATGSNA